MPVHGETRHLRANADLAIATGVEPRNVAMAEDGSVRVAVEDQGPGLPDVDVARLFMPFQRGHQEGTIAGAGLGLAICRAIIVGHGGRIEATHAPGGGARFEFTLPTSEPVP